MKAERIMLSNC